MTAFAITAPGLGRWIAVVTGLLGIAMWMWAPRTWRLLAIVCALLVLLGARIDLSEWQRRDPALLTAVADQRPIELSTTVRGFPEVMPGSHGRTDGSWVRVDVHTDRGRVPALLWFDTPRDDALAPGAGIRVTGRLSSLGADSAAAYGVAVTRVIEAPGGPRPVTVALRTGLRGAAARVAAAELVPGFAVGDTSLVGDTLEARMQQSSLTHLVAVSGANCALVTGALLSVAARLGAGRRTRIVAAGGALSGFVAIVGPDPSVQRAAIMASVVLLSGFGGKRAVALPSLGLAMVVLLITDPWQSLQPGFALSVAATAGILLLVPPLVDGLRRRVRWPMWLALPVAVALSAQFACGPLLLLLQPGLPVVGVLANVLAAPAAPLGTGLGLVAMLVLPFAPDLGAGIVALAALPAGWVAATAEICAALPLARWAWPDGWAGALLLAAVHLLLVLAWAVRSGRIGLPGGQRVTPRTPWRERGSAPVAARTLAATLCCTAGAVVLSVTAVVPLTERAGVPGDWAVVACDVGQGDAVLLRDPARPAEPILVDTGDDPELLRSCLQRFGVSRLSLLVLTHDDRDHVGALEAVAGIVDRAIIAPASREKVAGEARPLVTALERADLPFEIVSAGAQSPRGAAVPWTVLAPPHGAVPASTNAGSLIMMVRLGGLRVLLLGDSGRTEHAALLRSLPHLEADVVKVAHHGSRDAEGSLLSTVGAQAALIPVGADNGYGHPAPEILRTLRRAGTETLRTDELGSVAIAGDPEHLRVWTERTPADVRPGK